MRRMCQGKTKHYYFYSVLFLCLMECQKMFDDESFSNSDYAVICGINPNDLLSWEYTFLKMIDFNMYIGHEEFKTYKENFINLYSRL